MRPIDLEAYLNMLLGSLLGKTDVEAVGYLRDRDGSYHCVSDVDLLSDRIRCEDGYWDCFEWIITSDDDRLYIEE